MTGPGEKVRAARRRRAWTQAELAARAGVSRQLVVALETGRHLPRVDAAIALARALRLPAEQLFAPTGSSELVGVADDHTPAGTPVRIGRVGSRIVYAPANAEEAWPAADGVVAEGGLRLVDDAEPGTVVVGCDPALGLAAALTARGERVSALAVPGSTRSAVAALNAGRAHGALVHAPESLLPTPPASPGVRQVHVARWRVGIAVPPNSRPDWPRILSGSIPVAQREPGAAAQEAFARAVDGAGGALPGGPIAGGHRHAAHLAVALQIPAITIEPAALAAGLAFHPLETHTARLWIAAAWIRDPGVQALGDVLASGAFRTRLGLVGGYDLVGCGREID